jgi:RNA polymerase sigma-70 factor (ECF subfamily)
MKETVEQDFLREVNAHRGILYKLARVYSRSQQEMDDLTQDMLLQLWRSFASFRGESSIKTWMYRVCLNTALTYYKREVVSKREESTFQLPELAAPEESDYREERQIMYTLIQSLSDVEKALILLYLEGFSGQEIAGNMGLSEGNVRVRLMRIKEKLKERRIQYGYTV